MPKEPHPALADSVLLDWAYLNPEDHDPEDDRLDFIGVPGHQGWTFNPEVWAKYVDGQIPAPHHPLRPPEHFQSDPE